MNKILFTGSLGFIFSNFIRKSAYEKAPYIYSGIDKAVSLKQLNNVYNNKIMSSNYLSDITDQHIINNIFEIEKPEIVMHAAAYTPSSENYSEIKECYNTNVVGTTILLDACKKYNVSKFIYLSTDKLYSSTSLDSGYYAKESDTTNPCSQMAIAQLAAERLVINSGINYNILRICDVYGPRQDKESFVVKTIKHIRENKDIIIEGDGAQICDWMHVFDLSSALLLILKSKLNNEIINISSKQECSVLEMVQFICNSMKSGHELIKFEKEKMNHIRYSMDNQKLVNLGWKNNFKLKQGIEETCNWINLNQWILK